MLALLYLAERKEIRKKIQYCAMSIIFANYFLPFLEKGQAFLTVQKRAEKHCKAFQITIKLSWVISNSSITLKIVNRLYELYLKRQTEFLTTHNKQPCDTILTFICKLDKTNICIFTNRILSLRFMHSFIYVSLYNSM